MIPIYCVETCAWKLTDWETSPFEDLSLRDLVSNVCFWFNKFSTREIILVYKGVYTHGPTNKVLF